MKESPDDRKEECKKVKPPNALRYGKEDKARYVNIRKPPPRKEDKDNARARQMQINLWIFLNNMKWDPATVVANGISWIELLALAERKEARMEENIKSRLKCTNTCAPNNIKQLLNRFKEETKIHLKKWTR